MYKMLIFATKVMRNDYKTMKKLEDASLEKKIK